MKSADSTSSNDAGSRTTALALCWCLMFAPILGCTEETGDVAPAEQSENGEVGESDSESSELSLTESASVSLQEAWHTITESTETGLTIVSEKCEAGSEMVVDATRAAYIWSSDKTANGWEWIVENAGDATEWAKDSATESWAVTRAKTGEFSLWVQVEAENGVAWARTALPEAWKVTKDATGEAVVWIDEHKVEVAVAAAVVAVIVGGLIVAPEGVAPAIVKGAVAGSVAETAKFLTAVWKNRGKTEHGKTLGDVTHDLFMSIGKSVVSQCGSQVLGSLTAGADAA